MAKSQYRYFCGKRYRRLEDGSLIFAPKKRESLHGVKKVTMRVPVTLVPFINEVLGKLAEIQEIKLNIEGNYFNTSADVLINNKMEN